MRVLWDGDSVFEPGFARRMASWLAEEGSRRTMWLAADGEEPVGMVSLHEYRRMPKPGREDSRWGYVGNLFVREEWRGRGVASALLAEVIATAEAREYVRLLVSPSPEALSLFRRAGFVQTAETPDADVLVLRD